jgi:capsular exopolysaccharide synthesis family protein
MASAGESVVVVDCDLRRPTVHVHLDLERDHGLTNYLTGPQGEDIAKYLKSGHVPNLSVLTCGPIPPNPPELFAGERFQALLTELRSRFDWVVLDSPPVISLTDSIMLASMADMVAFVIKHNESERDMIKRCLQNIRNVNPHVIGAILNNVDIEKSYSKDYYYAGYYYYAGDSEDPKKKKKRGRSHEPAAGEAPSA